jgi:hypothetical protein
MRNSYLNAKDGTFSFTCEKRPSSQHARPMEISMKNSFNHASQAYDRFNIQNTFSCTGSPIVNKVISFQTASPQIYTNGVKQNSVYTSYQNQTSRSKSPRRFVIDNNPRTNSPAYQNPSQFIKSSLVSANNHTFTTPINPSKQKIGVHKNGESRVFQENRGWEENKERTITTPMRTVYAKNQETTYTRPIDKRLFATTRTDVKFAENLNGAQKFPYPFQTSSGRYGGQLEKLFNEFHHDCYHKITNNKDLTSEVEELLAKVVQDAEAKLRIKNILV